LREEIAARFFTAVKPEQLVLLAPEEGVCRRLLFSRFDANRRYVHVVWVGFTGAVTRLVTLFLIDGISGRLLCLLTGVYLAMLALLRPGDHVIVTYPGYQSLYDVALTVGCSVDRWEPRLDDSATLFDVADAQVCVLVCGVKQSLVVADVFVWELGRGWMVEGWLGLGGVRRPLRQTQAGGGVCGW
jgi:hypothetical protein